MPANEALVIEHRAACDTIPEHVQALSSFDSYAFGSARVGDGILIHLVPEAGPPEVLLVAIRCHEVWLRLSPRAGARDDVMAVDGTKVVVHAAGRDAIEVMISSPDPRAIDQLERRAQIAVRRARQLRAQRGSP